ncbi:MAG: hypothetical protein SRB2_00033 [Desulfobacteraceae bacterium Eth-SRB2]|nr:MAG: hypothetical protein SRB2_00033 [Desulfobacteraceae bacterium Eth-SRB2]
MQIWGILDFGSFEVIDIPKAPGISICHEGPLLCIFDIIFSNTDRGKHVFNKFFLKILKKKLLHIDFLILFMHFIKKARYIRHELTTNKGGDADDKS